MQLIRKTPRNTGVFLINCIGLSNYWHFADFMTHLINLKIATAWTDYLYYNVLQDFALHVYGEYP